MSQHLKEHLVDYEPLTGRMRTPPQQLFIELSSRCNLKCVHCPRDYGAKGGDTGDDMSLETIQSLGPWLRRARFVNLNMVGEPMVSPHFDEILELCGQGDAEVSFNTNGLLLTQRRAAALVEHGAQSIGVSIDGMESMLPIRGVPYTAVRRRLLEFDAARERAGSETPHLAIAFVMMRRNAFELAKVLRDLLPRIRVHAVHVQPLVIYYETLRGENIYVCSFVNEAVEEAREVAERHGVGFTVFRSKSSDDERHRTDGPGQLGQHSERFGCIDPFYEVKIRSTGEVMACSYGLMPGLQVRENGLEEVWNHEWYRALRRRLYENVYSGSCERCPYVHGCAAHQEDSLRPGVHHSQEARFFRGGYGRRRPAPATPSVAPFDPGGSSHTAR